jgi:D-threo-aldose 1-dehydrogenase
MGDSATSIGGLLRTNRIGRSKLLVTAMGIGGGPLGNLFSPVSDGTARDAVLTAWDYGVRYFDTAPHYGLGLSERRLGDALKEKDRNEFIVSTKVGRLLRPNENPTGSDLDYGFAVNDDLRRVEDYSSDGVNRSIEESLERLGMDRVDIVYVHDPDEHVDQVILETLPALERLRDQGLVGAIGAGMNHWEPLLRFVQECDIDVVMLAGRWTLIDRSGEPLLAECDRRNVSVIAAGPFSSGILSREVPTADDHYEYGDVPSRIMALANACAELCSNYAVELPQVALNFPLRHDAVAAVVVGVRNSDEAAYDVGLLGQRIPEQLWNDLDRLYESTVESG